MTTLNLINNYWIKKLDKVLLKQLKKKGNERLIDFKSFDRSCEIINCLEYVNQDNVLDNIRECDPDLAQKIIDKTYQFEDLIELQDVFLEKVLSEITNDSLGLSMRLISINLKKKIFKVLSENRKKEIKKIIKESSPIKKEIILSEQLEIMKVFRRLLDDEIVFIGENSCY